MVTILQAFKASNPNCRLEDFIRWYSPRDWITVLITRPIIPEVEVNPDLINAVESENTQHEEHGTKDKDNDEIFGPVSYNEIATDADSIEESVHKSYSNDVPNDGDASNSENVLSINDITVNLKNGDTTETEDLVDDERSLQHAYEPNPDSDEPNFNSDDEFVDAPEDPEQFSEKSDSNFLSVSEASIISDQSVSVSPLPENSNVATSEANSSLPETSNIANSETNSDSSVLDKTTTAKQFFDNSIKYEQPLDPEKYGGHLSARMSKESVWKELWHIAKPIPIRHQKRLFDDTKEAEKILHYFMHSKIKTIAMLIMPALLHAAYDRIFKCPESSISFIKEKIDKLYQKLSDIHRYSKDDTDHFYEIITEIYNCELTISKYFSLKCKLAHQSPTIQKPEPSKRLTELERRTRRKGPSRLSAQHPHEEEQQQPPNDDMLLEQLMSSEVELVGAARSTWGSVLQRLFHAQQVATTNAPPSSSSTGPPLPRQVSILPAPVGREYILQTVTRHPSSVSRECPQRMFVTVSSSEFRMAFANSSDKTFL